MTIKPFFFSTFYSVGQLGLGLLLHPYQTMQSVVQEKVFVWMTLVPSVVLAVLTIVWRFVIVPLVQLLFTCRDYQLWACHLLPVASNWIAFFCIYWQILLFYLLFRFTVVFNQKNEGI
jgi:hypothetical protein